MRNVNHLRLYGGFLLCVAISAILGFVPTAIGGPVTTDAFDINQGSQPTGWSSLTSFSAIGDMFGGTLTSLEVERGCTLFADGYPVGHVHWVKWQTAGTISLAGFELYADADGDLKRGFDHLTLTYDTGDGNYSGFVYDSDVVYDPHGYLDLSVSLASPVTADRFYAAFTQSGSLGPRVTELDAVVPEPATLALVALGGMGALLRRRR